MPGRLIIKLPDLTELDLPSTMKTVFPDPNDVLNFKLTITPDEGIYKGGVFTFSFVINPNYPHEPPKVKCLEKIYHPNLDLEGNVCLWVAALYTLSLKNEN